MTQFDTILTNGIGVPVFALYSYQWNWCSRIRSVLERAGLDQTWESRKNGNKTKFMLLFKESIVRIFTQRWRNDIKCASKLCTYALVQHYFCVESYILYIRGGYS